jgi:photosystem II stability/assembly factor-like uncharacterized protein
MQVKNWSLVLLLGLVISLSGAAAAEAMRSGQDQELPPSKYGQAISHLKFRELGPAIMGGRVDEFAVVESDPRIVYVGLASGGVWKTTNAGTTWTPIFDDYGVASVGALAVAPTDSSIVWVGTGENNNRQSSSWGDGVYKSTDAGATFQHMGLTDTHHIGRVAIHPTDPDTVFIAAVGHLWGPNPERGLYRTTDGGRSWEIVLYINDDTGVTDVLIDPEAPDTVYAAAYQRRRTSFGFNGGGPHGAIYKSDDGGATWRKLIRGLPYENEDPEESRTGRIGLAMYRRDSSLLYALVEHAEGGVFRSEDKGETWTRMSDVNPRPPYFSQIIIDPNDDQQIWVLGVRVYYSEDGGRTFDRTKIRRIHTDFHALWINPRDSRHMIMGTDGGIHWSWDGGSTWDFVNTIPIGQFYEVSYDMQKPYRVTGGLQDNGSWIGPSMALYRVFNIGITNCDWIEVGGSDGYHTLIDPADPNIVYTETPDGNPWRGDLRTHERVSIRPPHPEGLPHNRFQWDTPLVISAHDPKVIYYASQYLYRSTDRGDSWTRISPDLTTGTEQNSLPTMGRLPDRKMLSRQFGVWNWPCVTVISESPFNPDLLWIGTDDGCLQVTQDRGQTWQNVISHIPDLPKMAYVSRVVASQHDEGSAYVTFDNHRLNDFEVYVYVTTDFGRTFKSITNGIPEDKGTVHVIREHHRNPDLLFVGTETGVHVTFDRGANWVPLRLNLPTVPVFDLALQPRENDLIVGTHGRSIWILDDITFLEQVDDGVLTSDLHLFDMRPATAWRIGGGRSDHAGPGHKIFIAENPPYGVIVNYYLKEKAGEDEPVMIAIEDESGKSVREFEGPGEPGINRTAWDLRPDPPIDISAEEMSGMRMRRGLTGPRVEPGRYTVKVSVGQHEAAKSVMVEEDPRIETTAVDRAARYEAVLRASELNGRAVRGMMTITGLHANLTAALEASKRPEGPRVPEDVRRAAAQLLTKLDVLNAPFVREPMGLEPSSPRLVWQPPSVVQRASRLSRSLEGYTAAPSAALMQELDAVAKRVAAMEGSISQVVDKELVELNRKLTQAGLSPISTRARRTR